MPKKSKLIIKFIKSLKGISFLSRLFLVLRLQMLPLMEMDEALPKEGKIVDVGCGRGHVCAFLSMISKKRKIIGVDSNSRLINEAKKIKSNNEKLSFEKKNIFNYNLGEIDGAIMSDFLHHLSYNEQEVIIKNIYKNLKKNGTLVIKEIDADEKIRSKLSFLWDKFLYPDDKVCYRNKKNWMDLVKKVGFETASQTAVKWFPGSTTLFICKK